MTEIEVINKYLGIPYLNRGRTMEALDCWGLIIAVYKDLGFALPDTTEEYDEDWSWQGKDFFLTTNYSDWQKVLIPGSLDVVLFQNSKGIANHGGIMLKNNRFLHACRAGVVIGKLEDFIWKKRIYGFYHLRLRND